MAHQRLSVVASLGCHAAARDTATAEAPQHRSRRGYSLSIIAALHDAHSVVGMHDGWGRSECRDDGVSADRNAHIRHRSK